MELWIRSQNKEKLELLQSRLKVQETSVNPHSHWWCILCDGSSLAEYNSKERALEVLDEIQNKLNEANNSYEDLANKLKIFSETPIIKCDNNDNCTISLNIAMLKDMIIYEMPKE